MSNNAPKLSIRVKLKEDEETREPETHEEVVLLWDRIIGLALALGLVATGLSIGVWYWLHDPQPTASRQMAATEQAAPALDTAETEAVRQAVAQEPAAAGLPAGDLTRSAGITQSPMVEPAPSLLANAEPSNTQRQPQPGLEEPTAAAPTEAQTGVGATQAPRAFAGEDRDGIEAQSLAAPQFEEQQQDQTEAASAAVSAESDAVGESGDAVVHILSDHLVRAQLTRDVVDREPVDNAPAVIQMNDEGILKVFFFTELARLQGETLYYDWYLGDERMARVTIRPHLQSMRAYAVKHIDQTMLGSWQVRVQTADDSPLAMAEFEVR